MTGPGPLLYKRGWYVAVLGAVQEEAAQEEAVWYGVVRQHVNYHQDTFILEWLEQVEDGDEDYYKSGLRDRIHLDSCVTRVRFFPSSNAWEGGGKLYTLPQREKLKVAGLMKKKKAGLSLEVIRGESRTVAEDDSMDTAERPTRKRKLEKGGKKSGKKKAAGEKQGKAKKPRKCEGLKKEKKMVKEKKVKVAKEKKVKMMKEKKVKVPKVKIDRSNPNWRLKPNMSVAVWEKDPLFESNTDVPFVSSLAHSRLVIRAVLTQNMKLLKQCVENKKEIASLHVRRSSADQMSALRYAAKMENLEMVKILLKSHEEQMRGKEKRCEMPLCLLPVHGTGTYNYRSLGIKKIRRLNLSRGSREGNNALTKDHDAQIVQARLANDAMAWNLSQKFIASLSLLLAKGGRGHQALIDNVDVAIRNGNREIAAVYIGKDIAQGYQTFSHFFVEALVGKGDPWDGQVREVSVRKKATNFGITPMHCAAINPNTGPLEALYLACPDIYMCDAHMRKPVHYAAACTHTKPLEFLEEKGANLSDPDRLGQTPLLIACRLGRDKSVKFILEKLAAATSSDSDEYFVKKYGLGGVDRPGKDSWCALHVAVAEQRIDAVKVLLEYKARPDQALNTRYDRMTPLMLAAANSDLAMVRLLVEHRAKVEKRDRYGRTALVHAVINGSASVASYLLSLGADPNTVDTSGNGCLHYACAYGWWFCMDILIQAGATVDLGNEWKLTPLGVSVLKGHKGITDYLVTLPNIDINSRDDQGRTILLNMLVDNGEPMSNEKISEVKRMVAKNGADPKSVDNKGRNALHYIASYKVPPSQQDKLAKMSKLTIQLLNFFLQIGVNPYQVDTEGKSPFQNALENTCSQFQYMNSEDCKKPDLELIKVLITAMCKKECFGNILDPEKLVLRIYLDFCISINPRFSSEYLDIFNLMNDFTKGLLQANKLKDYAFMDKLFSRYPNDASRKYGTTVFAEFCESYCGKNINNFFQTNGEISLALTDQEKFSKWKTYTEILEKFMDMFNPRLCVETRQKNEHESRKFYALLKFSRAKDRYLSFNMIMSKNPDVHVSDENGFDAMNIMIDSQNLKGVQVLISVGSDVNRVRVQKDEHKKITSKDLPIQRAVLAGNLEIITDLLANGALVSTKSLTGESLIHLAVRKCALDKTSNNVKIVKTILDHGAEINEVDDKLRTPLHLAVNLGKDDPDASLDLEMLLLKRKANLKAVDVRGRTPLFYAFVKIGKFSDSQALDPIQIVSSLIDSMDKRDINIQDNFGSSALHYAAYRGAAVCSLLLLQKGADIEVRDSFSQTPLSLAVLGRHDSCALMLIQRDANVNVEMMAQKLAPLPAADDTEKVESLWKYLPNHFDEKDLEKMHSVFQGIIINNWHGITYVVLAKLENFGLPFSRAIEVAFQIKKFQFAKTLISKQLNVSKLKVNVSHRRSLINSLAFEYPSPRNDLEKELLQDVYDLLSIEAGVDSYSADDYGCTPLHYACLNKNRILMENLLKIPEVKQQINSVDVFGRTPLSAYCWNYSKLEMDDSIKKGLHILFENGADANVLFKSIPLDCLDDGYEIRHSNTGYLQPLASNCLVTPLIVAICHKDVAMIDFLISNGADVQLIDSKEESPLEYALKTNDPCVINNVTGHINAQSSINISSSRTLNKIVAMDPNVQGSLSYDNAELYKCIKNVVNVSKADVNEALLLAANVGATTVGDFLAKQFHLQFKPKLLLPPPAKHEVQKYNFNAQIDADEVISSLDKKMDTQTNDESKKNQHGCTVTDGHIHGDYDILMNKVDVGMGAYGLYNFYRIQIWKENHKDLYVLFTQWGRIERWGHGQYQNTPFSTAEEAEKEFKKIFKSKTGNEWEDREAFVNNPKKYRLVLAEHSSTVKQPSVKFDLNSKSPPMLPIDKLVLLRDMANVKIISKEYASKVNIESSAVPFGRIKKDALKRAKSLLQEMRPLVLEKEKLDEKKYKNTDNQKVLDRLNQVLDQLIQFSSEYYSLVPTKGFEYVRVPPIDNLDTLTSELRRLDTILEFERAESMLLGAMLRKNQVHPLDYIYSVLGCRVEPLLETNLESQLIMRYLYRSKGDVNQRVEAVYRIEREGEVSRMTSKSRNRRLLWHGTKQANLLSILNQGLIQNARDASQTGQAFGNGVYFADVFNKSVNYSDGENGLYMLLCDVDLGKCRKIDNFHSWYNNDILDRKDEDAFWILGRNAPSPLKDVQTPYGFKIPLGEIVKEERTSDDRHRRELKFSEYVVFNTDNIVIRYLVKLGNGRKKAVLEDFYNLPDEPLEDDEPMVNGGIDEDEEEEEDVTDDNASDCSDTGSAKPDLLKLYWSKSSGKLDADAFLSGRS